MPAPIVVPPDQALHSIIRHSKEPRSVQVDSHDALGRFLLDDLELETGDGFPGDPEGTRRASVDGYALAAPAASGEERVVVDGERAGLDPLGVWRVPLGASLEESAVAVADLASVRLLNGDRIRIERDAAEGLHVLHAGRQALRVPAGTRVDARLQSVLLASGRDRVRVGRRPKLGVVYLGRGLRSLDESPSRGPGDRRDGVPDLTAHWISALAERAGWDLVRLGRGVSSCREFQRAFQRGQARATDVLLVIGGTGDDVEDRATEWIVRIDGQVRIERVALDLAGPLLWGKVGSMDVVGIGGAPLASSIAWDLFVVPYLLRRAGAGRTVWDWRGAPVPPCSDLPPARRADGLWTVRPARWAAEREGRPRRLEILDAPGPLAPGPLGGAGWVLIPPTPAGDETRARGPELPPKSPERLPPELSGPLWCALTASGWGL